MPHLDTVLTVISQLCDSFDLSSQDKMNIFALWEPFRHYKEPIFLVETDNKDQLHYKFLATLSKHGESIVRTALKQNCKTDWLTLAIQLMEFQMYIAQAIQRRKLL